jgi:pimeloyl-ACP methyl ester carboxylesterase
MTPDAPLVEEFTGAGGLPLAGDVWGPSDASTVVMLHGGGQTRHSWKETGRVLARHGLRVVTIDLRGHGDSGWSPDGVYGLDRYRDDVLAVLDQLASPAMIVGASLGGLTGMLVASAAGPARVPGLVLVDVVPRIEPAGGARITGFMAGHGDGFGSLDEAAEAVAEYLPHRTRPRTPEGLRRNLRLREDGRWYWHWDPRMLAMPTPDDRAGHLRRLEDAARTLDIPVLLLWGRLSDVVSAEGVDEFRALVPHAEVVALPGAAHTAAGDDNDAFTRAVVDFCTRSRQIPR